MTFKIFIPKKQLVNSLVISLGILNIIVTKLSITTYGIDWGVGGVDLQKQRGAVAHEVAHHDGHVVHHAGSQLVQHDLIG